jgi:membrane peptidoglycan carboxypeptidase
MPLPGRTQNNKNLPMPIGSNPYIYTQAQVSGSEKNRNQGMTYPQHPYPSSSAGKLQKPERRPLSISMKQGMGCILRMFLLAALAGIVVILVGGSFVLYEYYNIAATLPSVADLQLRASTFETTRIFDRNGNLLYEILDPTAGRRTFITLDKISPYLVAATIATEDKSFYSHPGFDWTAIVRAFWQNFRGGETISGASTITQQLARGLLFSPEERFEQTYMRKVREALLAS